MSPTALAGATGRTLDEVEAVLERWPAVTREEDGRVSGFWGLRLAESPYRLEIDGRTLHAECAFDATFLPELLEARARITSTCPMTGRRISFRAGPAGVDELEPATAVISIPGPRVWAELDPSSLIRYCCPLSHFFADPDAAAAFVRDREGADIVVLQVDAAHRLARRWNWLRFGAELVRGRAERC